MRHFFSRGQRHFSARLDELDTRLVRSEEVLSLLQADQKSQAIKIYREDTGASQADALAAVERMELAQNPYGASSFLVQSFEMPREEIRPAGNRLTADPDEIGKPLEDEIERLLGRQEKIKAIKLYRERTGLGLRESKEAVDRIEHEMHTGNFLSDRGENTDRAVGEQRAIEQGPWVGEIRRLVESGEMIRAIKLYREHTGLGLHESKEAIDQISNERRGHNVLASNPYKPGGQQE